MVENVNIQLISSIQQNKEKEIIEQTYNGQLICKQNSWYIRYIDTEQGKVTIKYNTIEKIVTILYDHYIIKKIVFDMSQSTIIQFETINNVPLTIHTQQIHVQSKKDFLNQLMIHYFIQDEEQTIGEYTIMLSLTKL